jgi:hypothetical protein
MLRRLENLEVLSLHTPGLDNESLGSLAALPKLRELSCGSEGRLTISGLGALNALAGLEKLSVTHVRQDGGGLGLSGLTNLRSLTLRMWSQTRRVRSAFVTKQDAFDDDDLACLSDLTALEELHLCGGGIGDAGLAHLGGLTRLERLEVGGGSELTDEGFKDLAGLRRLERLDIRDSRVAAEGLSYLHALKGLQVVHVRSTASIPNDAVARLGVELPHLERLDVASPRRPRRPIPSPPTFTGLTWRFGTKPVRPPNRGRRRR